MQEHADVTRGLRQPPVAFRPATKQGRKQKASFIPLPTQPHA